MKVQCTINILLSLLKFQACRDDPYILHTGVSFASLTFTPSNIVDFRYLLFLAFVMYCNLPVCSNLL